MVQADIVGRSIAENFLRLRVSIQVQIARERVLARSFPFIWITALIHEKTRLLRVGHEYFRMGRQTCRDRRRPALHRSDQKEIRNRSAMPPPRCLQRRPRGSKRIRITQLPAAVADSASSLTTSSALVAGQHIRNADIPPARQSAGIPCSSLPRAKADSGDADTRAARVRAPQLPV